MNLMNKWFSRPLTTGRSRTNSPVSPLERLEPRLALAGDVARPLLEPAAVLYLDSTMFGPEPVVMTKSQVVGHDENSFVISHVPTGSVVEKLDAEMNTWVDVSTKPTSSNPRELLRLLQRRLIKHGEKIRWVTESNHGGELTEAFRLISWDDGSKPVQREESSPSDVSDLVARAGDVGGELVIEWSDLNDDVSSYSVLVSSEEGSQIHKTTSASLTLQNMPAGIEYEVEVWATNENGSSSTAGTFFTPDTYNILLTPESLNLINHQKLYPGGNLYWEHWSNGIDLPHSTISMGGLVNAKNNHMSLLEARNALNDYLIHAKGKPTYYFSPSLQFSESGSLYLAHYNSQKINNVLNYFQNNNKTKNSTFTKVGGTHFTISYKKDSKIGTDQIIKSKAHAFVNVNNNVLHNQKMHLTITARSNKAWVYNVPLIA